MFSNATAGIAAQQARQAAKPASPAARRPGAKAPASAVREPDALDLEVQDSAAEGNARSLKGNGDQETADDRARQDRYRVPPKPEGKQIDLQG